MKFEYTKKYLMDMASLRLDCKIQIINSVRKKCAEEEYYWEYGVRKKLPPKYGRLTNKEISPSNPPLIGQIRNGKVNAKNPFLFTYNTLVDIYNNCKFNPFESEKGLTKTELSNFRKRNLMFDSYEEIFFGSHSERQEFDVFFSTAVIFDIISEEYDENFWKIILGYIPLNITFEKIKISVGGDIKKIYKLLVKDNWEDLLAGICRAIKKRLPISTWFEEYYESSVQSLYGDGENQLKIVHKILNDFYSEVLKKKVDNFVSENDYVNYRGKYILENSAYQSFASIISIQHEMELYQKYSLEADSLIFWMRKEPWEVDFLPLLEKKNRKEKLWDEEADLLYATRVLKAIKDLLDNLIGFQILHENDEHWEGNYLNYVKKYHNGDEIINYFKTGDREILRPLIENVSRRDAYDSSSFNERMYIKKHPDCWIARERYKERIADY